MFYMGNDMPLKLLQQKKLQIFIKLNLLKQTLIGRYSVAKKAAAKKKEKSFEETLWDAANKLRGSVESFRQINIDMSWLKSSALTNHSLTIPEQRTDGIPVTYVPARNTIMMSLAVAWAETVEANDIFLGVNAVDYSGYPDCRPEYIKAYETMVNLGIKSAVEGEPFHIHTPLIQLSKEDIILKGLMLGVDYSMSVSCYQADADGRACGKCDSCDLRQKGFEKAGVKDPTLYR